MPSIEPEEDAFGVGRGDARMLRAVKLKVPGTISHSMSSMEPEDDGAFGVGRGDARILRAVKRKVSGTVSHSTRRDMWSSTPCILKSDLSD